MIKEWTEDIKALAKIAEYDPQLVYTAYVFGTSKRWQYVCRTTPKISGLKKLEEVIKSKLIPKIIGKEFSSDKMRAIMKLPARLGGFGFQIPAEEAQFENENSQIATKQLTEAITLQQATLSINATLEEAVIKLVSKWKAERQEQMQLALKETLSERQNKLLLLSSEKGVSIWLTTIPLKGHGFCLNKQQFIDVIAMRCDLRLKDVPEVLCMWKRLQHKPLSVMQ